MKGPFFAALLFAYAHSSASRGYLKAWKSQLINFQVLITYLPHKAVAEVSKDKEPIGRGCVEFKWFESQLMSDSSELSVK